MKLSYLRYYQTVCKYNNLSRAAEELFISQPTLSHAVNDMEKEFGVRLFVRQRNGIRLTEEGMRLKELSEELLKHADAVQEEMISLGKKEQSVNLGMPTMLGSLVFPELFREMRTRHPKIRMNVTETGSGSAIQQVSDGLLEAAIVSHSEPLPGIFGSVAIRKIPVVLYLSIENPAASMVSADPGRIEELPLVMLKEGSFISSYMGRYFKAHGITPNIILHTNNLHTIRNLLNNDSAAAFLYEGTLLNIEENIVAVPLPDAPEIKVSLIWNKGQKQSAELKSLIQVLKSAAPARAASEAF